MRPFWSTEIADQTKVYGKFRNNDVLFGVLQRTAFGGMYNLLYAPPASAKGAGDDCYPRSALGTKQLLAQFSELNII